MFTKFSTSSRGLKTVKEVHSLDVVGQCGVWHQGSVSVNASNSKFKGEFIHTDRLILPRLKDASCNQNKGKEQVLYSRLIVSLHVKTH